MKGLYEEKAKEEYLYKIVKRTMEFAGVKMEEKAIWDLIMLELINFKENA